jgi:hypothetical protein
MKKVLGYLALLALAVAAYVSLVPATDTGDEWERAEVEMTTRTDFGGSCVLGLDPEDTTLGDADSLLIDKGGALIKTYSPDDPDSFPWFGEVDRYDVVRVFETRGEWRRLVWKGAITENCGLYTGEAEETER